MLVSVLDATMHRFFEDLLHCVERVDMLASVWVVGGAGCRGAVGSVPRISCVFSIWRVYFSCRCVRNSSICGLSL